MARNSYDWFKFYFRDWLESERVQRMAIAAQGLYIRALALQGIYGSIPADLEDLSLAMRVKISAFSDWDQVLPHFEVEEVDGEKRLYNKDLRAILVHKQKLSKTRSKIAANAKQLLSNSTSKSEAKASTRARARSNSLSKSESKSLDDSFNSFWEVYPNRKDKEAARKAWVKLNPDEFLARQIAEHVSKRAFEDEQWTKENRKFVPMGSTFLNNKRWTDEYAPSCTIGPISNRQGYIEPLKQEAKQLPAFDAVPAFLWEGVEYYFRQNDPEASEEWISPLKPLGVSGGELWVAASSNFGRDWVTRNYLDVIIEQAAMPVRVISLEDYQGGAC